MKSAALTLLFSIGSLVSIAPAVAATKGGVVRKSMKATEAKAPTRDVEHERQVSELLRFMKKETLTERTAAYFNIVPSRGLTQRVVVRSSHARSIAEEVIVRGAKDGVYHATFLGTVSAHDLGEVGTAQLKQRLARRILSDRVRVSFDYGPGSALTIVAERPSELVTRVDLEIPLNPDRRGVTRIVYDRVDKRSGFPMGGAAAYAAGRIEVIRQQ